MSRGKELIKNTAIVALGKVCTKMWIFLLLPFYTAILTTEEYGIVELLNTYVSLLLPVVAFQISDALFRFMIDAREKEEEKGDYFHDTVLLHISMYCVFYIVWNCTQNFIQIKYKEFLYLNVMVNIFSGTLFQLCRGLGDNTTYAVASFLSAGSAAVLNVCLVLVLDYRVVGMLSAIFFSQLISIIYMLFKEKVFLFLHIKYFKFGLLKRMLSYSLPLIPNYLCWWILGASDKTVVSYFLGYAQNGILSVSQKFSTVYTTVYNVFNLTWTENASLHKDDADSEAYYSSIIETTFRILECGCLGIIAVVGIVFPLLIHQKFDQSYYQIPIYLLSAFLHSVIGIFSVVYIALKKTKEIAKTSMYAAGINLMVNLCLIRSIGLYAASLSSVIAYGVLLWIRYNDIQKYMKVRIQKRTVISFIIMQTVVTAMYYMRNLWIGILNLILVMIYAVWINKSIIGNICGLINGRLRNR